MVCYLQLCCKRRIFAQNKPEMDKHTVSLKAKRLQSAGIVLSLLCAVHCMALPLLLMAGSFAAVSVLSNPWMELGLLPVGFAIAGWVLYKDYRLHSRKMPLLLFMFGVVAGVVGLIFHFHLFIGVGALLVMAAQFANFRVHKVYCAH
ncbi:MerC domain-containing protein [Sphingobacteriales bacterium UPWRP_1]|nr:hypothetical protein B6N25_10985 [Sphingobacteriales bacterium TSM_CSS]PSJ75663.1 MerC domain-containing protein [Sphingobacteriales bacterium UPWRP_1]